MGESETFSKIVKSLLLDVDLVLDQLVQIGYYNKEQRAFLDKYLYKSEEALRAGCIVTQFEADGGPHMADSVRVVDDRSTCGSTPTLAKSSPVSSVESAPVYAGRLRKLHGIIDEQTVLNNFLSRCNARNFSVQVSRAGVAQEILPKGKALDYINSLESIAEAGVKIEDSKGVEAEERVEQQANELSHDADVVMNEIETVLEQSDSEALDCDSTIDVKTGIFAHYPDASATDTQIPDAEDIKRESPGLGLADTGSIIADSDRIEAIEIISHDLDQFQAGTHILGPVTTPSVIIDVQRNDKIETVETENEETLRKPQIVSVPVPQQRKPVKTNAWGKQLKSSPRIFEGDVIGESAEPLGPTNIGHAMMQKMGWSGTGLGKKENGILQPVSQVMKNRKAGLGASVEMASKLSVCKKSCENLVTLAEAEAAAKQWRESEEAREKYEQLLVARVVSQKLSKPSNEQRPCEDTFRGIRALLLREGHGQSVRSIEFSGSKINSKKEIKTTNHYPGVVLKALTEQAVNSTGGNTLTKIAAGNHLEILRNFRGNEFHVYNFSKKARGIVRILQVEMYEEPDDTERNTSWE